MITNMITMITGLGTSSFIESFVGPCPKAKVVITIPKGHIQRKGTINHTNRETMHTFCELTLLYKHIGNRR